MFGCDIKRDRREIIYELSEFLKLSPGDVIDLLQKSTKLSAEEWREKFKGSAELDFYSYSKYYIFDLCYGNYWSSNTYLGKALIAKNSFGKILDYGAGVGSQLIMAWNLGFKDLTYYDVNGILFDFAKFRFKKRGMCVRMISASDVEDRLEESYDTIYCLWVLEHVKDPYIHLKRLNKHLKNGGRLFLAYRFGKDEYHPMEFDHNLNIDELLKSWGYEKKSVKLFHIVPLKGVKVYDKATRGS